MIPWPLAAAPVFIHTGQFWRNLMRCLAAQSYTKVLEVKGE